MMQSSLIAGCTENQQEGGCAREEDYGLLPNSSFLDDSQPILPSLGNSPWLSA